MCAELDRLSGDMNDRMRRIHRLLDVPKLVEGDSSWMRGVDMICQRVVSKRQRVLKFVSKGCCFGLLMLSFVGML